MADGILLERAGVPAVSICTDSFRIPAQAMAKVYGFPGYEFVTIPHPIASLDQAQIEARARSVLPAVVRILTAVTAVTAVTAQGADGLDGQS